MPDIYRRQFLNAASGLTATVFVNPRESAIDYSPKRSESVGPDTSLPHFKNGKSIRPHILAWGGNWLFGPGKGFEETTAEQREISILSMHPSAVLGRKLSAFSGLPRDTFGITSSTRGQLQFALDHGFRTPLGRTIEFGHDGQYGWYQALPPERKWQWPDGSPVESLDEVAARNPEGEIVDRRGILFRPSIHAPGVRQFFEKVAIDFVSLGTNGFWIDGNWTFGSRDFSEWAQEHFREYLKQASQDELDRVEVKDPESLDVLDEIRERTPLFSDAHPAEDPLYREFVKFGILTEQEFYASLQDVLATHFPEHEGEFLTFANLGDPLTDPHITAIISDTQTYPATECQKTVPPDHIYDFETKFLAAAGRFQRSGFHMGPHLWFEEPTRAIQESEMDLTEVQADFVGVHFAEQIANRTIGVADFHGDCCPLDRPIQEQAGNWLRPDGSLPDELRELTAFAWATEELLRGGKFAHSVAVVSSVPSNFWNSGSHAWGPLYNGHIRDSFAGACNIAVEDNHPYDVLIFGHPELWDDTVMLDRLSSYNHVLLPTVTCLTESQHTVLLDILDDGIQVIITGDPPSRDGDFEPLPTSMADELLNHTNSTVLSGSPARAYWRGEGNGEALRRALSATDGQVRTDIESNLEITIQTQTSPERVVVQLVNYDFDLDTGASNPISALNIDIEEAFDTDVMAARYYRPEAKPIDLDVDLRSERLSVTIPRLKVWGVLVLGPAEDAVTLAGTAAGAERALDDAKRAIEEAKADGRSSGLTQAKFFTTYATEALPYGAYRRAKEVATQAEEAAESATHPPTIGIDTSHNQPASGYSYEYFDDLRDTFTEEVTFTEVTDWSSTTLIDLDALIVPPALESKGESFDFTEDEARRLAAYVEAGGGVLFLGRRGLGQDITVVTDRFPLGFKSGGVRQPGRWGSEEIVRREITRINQTVMNIGGAEFGVVVDISGNATTLFEYPTDAELWRELEGDSQRQASDPDAAGEPFSAISRYGEGTVMAYGEIGHVSLAPQITDFEASWTDALTVLRGGITYMANRSLDSTPPTSPLTPTSSPTKPAPANTPTEKSTVVDTPGFTALIGLAGLVAAVAIRLLQGRRD